MLSHPGSHSASEQCENESHGIPDQIRYASLRTGIMCYMFVCHCSLPVVLHGISFDLCFATFFFISICSVSEFVAA